MIWLQTLMAKTGLLGYPLAALFLLSLVIIIYKMFHIRRQKIIAPRVVEKIEELLIDKKVPEAMVFCKQHPSPMTNILLVGIVNYGKSEAELKEVIEEAGRQEIPEIKKFLSTLGTIASLSPLLGLLGTVLGMIAVFATLARETTVNANMLAAGISEALFTTAFGLVIAMPALAFYNYYINKSQNVMIEMEKISLNMVKVLR